MNDGKSRLTAPGVVLVLFYVDLALGAAYLINEIAGHPRPGLTKLIDLQGEGNLPSWFSSMQLFYAGLLMVEFVRGRLEREGRKAWPLVLLPAILIAMSCDEVAQFHERVGSHLDYLLPGGNRANTMFPYTGVWMFVIGIPFALFLAWLLWRVKGWMAHVPRVVFRLGVGFGVLLLGALAMDAASNAFVMNSTAYNLCVLAEEMLEMMGGTVIAWGALLLVRADRAGKPGEGRGAA